MLFYVNKTINPKITVTLAHNDSTIIRTTNDVKFSETNEAITTSILHLIIKPNPIR